jgi:predicted outer membrane repeat protein
MKKHTMLTVVVLVVVLTALSGCAGGPADTAPEQVRPASSAQAGPVDLTGVSSYYVRADGNDKNAGISEDAPFKTLTRAVEAVKSTPVKKITVIGQLEDVATEIIDSGEAEILITGKPNPSEQETAVVATSTGLSRFVDISGQSRIRFEYITFTGGKRNMLLVERGAVVTLADGVVVTENSASTGAGVYADNATIYVKGNAHITKNDANSGGGFFIQNNSTLVVEDDAVISSNRALARNGGAINAQSGCTVIIRGNARIIDNEAEQTGGGISLAGDPPAAVATIGGNAVISGNKAAAGGGVAIWDGASLTITENAAITSNTATGQGGGGVLQLGTLKTEGGSITENRAPYDPDIAKGLQ